MSEGEGMGTLNGADRQRPLLSTQLATTPPSEFRFLTRLGLKMLQ